MSLLSVLDWSFIVAYLVLSVGIGLWFTRSAGKNLSSFFLGGRNLSWYIAGISMVATTFAADTPLAVTELVGKNGISGNWLWWNMLAGGMLTTFFFARLWRRSEVLTEAELIELRYSGREAAFLRGFKAIYLGLFMNMLIIGWVNVAMISILQGFFDLSHADALLYTAILMLFTAGYSSLSGLLGVAITDAFQFVIAMAGCIILAIITVNSPEVGGIAQLQAQLPAWSLSFFPQIGGTASDIGTTLAISVGSFFAYIGVQWWACWYPGAEPGGGGYVAQRMMSARSERDAVYATLFFQVAHYCLRPWPWIIVALCAMVLYPDLADKKMGYIMAMKQFLPNGLRGMMLVAFFAAYMSTISTQLNWGSSYLVNDLYYRFINPQADDKQLVSTARIVTLLLMAAGLTASLFIESISGVWSFLMECGAGLGLVLILRWYWWRINAWSEITATVAPFVAYACSKYALGLQFPQSFFLTVGFTSVAWLCVTYLTAPTDKAVLQRFYDKVRPGGWWQPIREQLNIRENPSLFPNFICWISSVSMTYSILFASGKLLFGNYMPALLWATLAVFSFGVLRATLSKI
jgi:SSS family solute:Na+ symporter